jgi:hypothetical protein
MMCGHDPAMFNSNASCNIDEPNSMDAGLHVFASIIQPPVHSERDSTPERLRPEVTHFGSLQFAMHTEPNDVLQ